MSWSNQGTVSRKARGGKQNPALLGFLDQFQELSFSHCQQHPSIPIVTSPQLSNQSQREARRLQTEAHEHDPDLDPDLRHQSNHCWVAWTFQFYLPASLSSQVARWFSPFSLQLDAETMKGPFFLGLCTKQFSVFWYNHDSSPFGTKAIVSPTTLCINVCWMKASPSIEIQISKIQGYRSEIQDRGEEAVFPKGMKNR